MSVADVPAADVPAVDAPAADVPAVVSDESSPPVHFLEAVTSLVRNATAVADFRQPLASQDTISSILARGAARRRFAPVSPSSAVPASVSSRYGPHAVCLPDYLSPGRQMVFDFHNLTRRVVIEDSATFKMYRECFYSDNRGPFPVKSLFLPGCSVPSSVTLLDPSVLPAKFPS